jgi:two-component system OmpR family response regulator
MLTARDQEDTVTRALNIGADDFLGKPFSYPILVARLRPRAASATPRPTVIRVGNLELDPAPHMYAGKCRDQSDGREFALALNSCCDDQA